MFVIDSSAMVELIALERHPAQDLRSYLDADDDIHAPHLLDAEFVQALRGLALSGQITPVDAEEHLLELGRMPITRYPHEPLVGRIWQLRDRLTAYDACYVVLAEALDCPLVSCDARLARAASSIARIELFSA